MRYVLLNQNYGVAEGFVPEVVESELTIEVDAGKVKINSPMTVKLVGKDETNYYSVRGGKCKVPARALKGKISVCIVYDGGVIPCTGIVAVKGEGGTITVLPDAAELTARVVRAERDISDALEALKRTEAKYDSITERLDKLFSGYHY